MKLYALAVNMKDQIKTELDVFRGFIDVAKLGIVPESVEKRHPPEPDIRCDFHNGDRVAFELVEICNSTNARFTFSAHQVYDLIMTAYSVLPEPIRKQFDARFVNVPLSFAFRPEISLMAIKNSLPDLLKELALQSDSNSYRNFTSAVTVAVIEVRRAGRADNPGAVNFNIAGSFNPIVSLDAVVRKLEKKYQCDTPVELLAYFGAFAWGHDRTYLPQFQEMLRDRGLGQFRRIWVMDWNGIALVTSSALTPPW